MANSKTRGGPALPGAPPQPDHGLTSPTWSKRSGDASQWKFARIFVTPSKKVSPYSPGEITPSDAGPPPRKHCALPAWEATAPRVGARGAGANRRAGTTAAGGRTAGDPGTRRA